MAQARDSRGRYISGTGRNPAIAVAIRATGLTETVAQFKAMQAQARLTLAHMVRASQQARASLDALAKPVKVTINGLKDIARTTALVGTLAAALAGIEGEKVVEAGNTMAGIKSGLKVAASSAYDTQKALRDMAEKSEVDRLADQMTDLEAKTFRAGYAAKKAAQDQVEASRRAAALRQEEFALSKMTGAEKAAYRQRDATIAADMELQNLRETTRKYGVDLESTASSYAAFANATKGSAAQGRITLQTMKGLVIASKGLNLNADQTERAMTTAAQIAAKGKLSQEEVLQLAEAGIPAQAILARGLGVTGAELSNMQAKGIDAATALDALSRQLITEFSGAAEEAAQRPAAAFARLRNAIFEARVQAADGGISRGLAAISDSATRMISAFTANGTFTRIGAVIGTALEKLPGQFDAVIQRVRTVAFYANVWFQMMQSALGIDTSGWSAQVSGGLERLRGLLINLLFEIPQIAYAMRQAFAGNDANVSERYAWVIPLRDFIMNQLLPMLREVPGILAQWWPAIQAAASFMISAISAIHQVFFGLFGEEAGRKILAFMVIAKVTGAFSVFASTISAVSTVVRGAMTAFTLLSNPMGWIILLIAAVVAGFIYAYTHFETFRKVVDTVVAAVWAVIKWFFGALWDKVKGTFDGLKEIWEGITQILTSPFEAAKKIIEGIMKVITGGYGFGDLIKGGKIILSKVSSVFGFASGGYVRGPGTGTSDSIPAWLSNREGVINAAATRHYGGERFINSLNDMSFSPFAAPADVIEVSSVGTGRPMSFVMPGVGTASGRVDDDFANGMKRVFDKATAGRARQAKPRGHR